MKLFSTSRRCNWERCPSATYSILTCILYFLRAVCAQWAYVTYSYSVYYNTHTLGEKVSEKFHFRTEKVYKQGRDEKASTTLPHYGMMPSPLWPPMQCTWIPSSLCYFTQQSELRMQVYCVGGQRGRRHRSIVG